MCDEKNKENISKDIPIVQSLKDLSYMADLALNDAEISFIQYHYSAHGVSFSALPPLTDKVRL